ncbi:MAG: acyl transferase, partial [Chitinophagaceae bacterium]
MKETGSHIIKEIFDGNNAAWEATALSIFNFQYRENAIYRKFCDILQVSPSDVQRPERIPFLP